MTLAERARKLREVSRLMVGREKLETMDALERDLTVLDAEIVGEGTDNEYAVVVFAEEPDKFLFGGMVLTDLIKDLKAQLASENLDLSDQLRATFRNDKKTGNLLPTEESLRVRMSRRTSNSKRGYTYVEVL